MIENTQTSPLQSPETNAETCYIVTHTTHDVDTMEVYAFDMEAAARNSIIDDARYIERNLMRHGQNPQIRVNGNGNTTISADDMEIFYAWTITESTIKRQSNSRGVAPKLDINVSLMKECFIVVEFNCDDGTTVSGYDT